MVGLDVTVVPVALRPLAEDAQSALMGVATLRPGGDWLSTRVTNPASALEVARRMLDDTVHPDLRTRVGLENAGVDYASGEPRLLFTAVLPIAAAELASTSRDWPLLTPWVGDGPAAARVRLHRLDATQAAIVAYWRGQLMRTTAAFDFLPRYFTMFQVRSVFSSIWGDRQPDGNFLRWLSSAEDVNKLKVCMEVDGEEARREIQASFAERLAAAAGVSAAMVKQQWDPKIIGTSAGVAGLAGLASLIPAAQVVGAIVGATIGYQRARGAGRPPRWYRRVVEKRILLRTWYPVRPPATKRPPAVVA